MKNLLIILLAFTAIPITSAQSQLHYMGGKAIETRTFEDPITGEPAMYVARAAKNTTFAKSPINGYKLRYPEFVFFKDGNVQLLFRVKSKMGFSTDNLRLLIRNLDNQVVTLEGGGNDRQRLVGVHWGWGIGTADSRKLSLVSFSIPYDELYAMVEPGVSGIAISSDDFNIAFPLETKKTFMIEMLKNFGPNGYMLQR